jgi:hypothetical protein
VKTRLQLGVCALLLSACTTMAPGAKGFAITRSTAEVEHCKPLGAVQSVPPYVIPGDDLKQLRNRSVPLGADTILLTSPRFVSTAGIAYRCKA